MDDVHFKLDKEALAELQQEIDAKVQDVIWQVKANMAKRSISEVIKALRYGFTEIGVEPDDNGLSAYAQASSDGTLVK